MKKENGSVTLYVIITCMFFIVILLLINIGIINKSMSQEKILEAMNKKYSVNEDDLEVAYNNIIGENKNLNTEEIKKLIEEYIGETKNPTGTIISYMGNNAPKGYLACDGKTYNISEYNELAENIKKEFGNYNYWGGDGTNTFAVPNLQGEFLRGYSTSSTNSRTNGVSTAAVGIHQDATYLPYMYTRLTPDGNGVIVFTKLKLSSNNDTYSGNMDLANIATGTNLYQVGVTGNGVNVTWQNSGYAYNYTTRPTNTTVLYCIKY